MTPATSPGAMTRKTAEPAIGKTRPLTHSCKQVSCCCAIDSNSAQRLLFASRALGACTSRYHAGIKQQAHDIRYTVRGIPEEVDRVLRRKAAQRNMSLNQVIVEELTAGTIGRRKQADFHDVAGQWKPDPAFDKIIATQRQIDPDKWN